MTAERTDFELPLMLRLLRSYPWLPRIPILVLKYCYHGYSFTTAHYVHYFVRSKHVKELNYSLHYFSSILVCTVCATHTLSLSLMPIEILSKPAYSGEACLYKTINTMITQPILLIFNLSLFVCF